MNRTVKFRGKSLETGEWIYGFYGHGLTPSEQFANFKSRIKKAEKGDPLYGSPTTKQLDSHNDLSDDRERHYIMVWTLQLNGPDTPFPPRGYFTDHLVDPDTVGQFTGTYIDGAELYEDDIVKWYEIGSHYMTEVVSWENNLNGFFPVNSWRPSQPSIIGNRHDNPELTPGGNNG